MEGIRKSVFTLERSDLETLKTAYLRVNALESLFKIDAVSQDAILQEKIKGDIISTKSRWNAVWKTCREKYRVPGKIENSLHFDFTTGDVFYYEDSGENNI